ncbi:type III-A CRISPR-associated RAMP protein Csm5 [Thermaurantimonas aggregans]|uniref:CRISPR system Cms protein Csm5 n=1 Tax=Thermaurantimonas aggregans TaxID=2173829 RepID=A0A401XLX2_9FLAO|nr:type III-A CRISPR-associated RAMP protein Csm5 [Thermaurantimonas aggregans]MCX8149530.1 type III-A CRISPR-associated RAMP protein Csm5 [Thermaurantimonas aggregans]GCD77994.1 type III-A CRISPR-associated RAMP protein Csm5 [Thermaurantimonas aggregans]
MIQYFKVTTLSPIFIGSGISLTPGADYVHFPERKIVAILEPEILFKKFDLDERFIEQWSNALMNLESRQEKAITLRNLLKQKKSNFKPEDISETIIPTEEIRLDEEIKKHLRSGNGLLMIPGSSIKGAIRTAFFSESLISIYNSTGGLNLNSFNILKNNNKPKYSDRNFNKKIFKNNNDYATHDFFRFLLISDGYAERSIIVKTLSVEVKDDNLSKRDDLRTFLECIPEETEFYIQMKWNENLFERNKVENNIDRNKNEELLSLLNISKDRTKKLFEKDKELFFDKTDHYNQESIEKIEESFYDKNSFVLRISGQTGYLNMTGGWQEDLLSISDQEELALYVRRITDRNTNNNSLPFPKSRRITADGKPLGYIKLTPIEKSEYYHALDHQLKKAFEKKEIITIPQDETQPRNEPEKPSLNPFFTGNEIKLNTELIAECISSPIGRKSRVKVFLKEPNTVEADMNGYASAVLGKLYKVKVTRMQYGKVTEVSFVREV